MRAARVLVVDHEPNTSALLGTALRRVGFEVRVGRSGHGALVAVEEFGPALVVLGAALPDLDGLAVTRRLRAAGSRVAVVVLSAGDTVEERVAGLSAGADDCVGNPFNLDEVMLRIGAVLRRTAPQPPAPPDPGRLRYADLELDDQTHEVRRGGRLIDLSPTEFRLLRYLLINAGRVASRAGILDRVWTGDFDGNAGIVESYVCYLRRKIDKTEPPLIHTVRGVGYALRLPSVDQ